MLGTTEGGAAASITSIQTLAAFKEKLAGSEEYKALAAEGTWSLLMSTLGTCGYEDKDFQELVADVSNLGASKFIARVPSGANPRALTGVDNLMKVFVAVGIGVEEQSAFAGAFPPPP